MPNACWGAVCRAARAGLAAAQPCASTGIVLGVLGTAAGVGAVVVATSKR